jgi:sulfur-oxidizing protein SoxA
MNPRLALCAIVLLAIAAWAAGITLAQNGPERPHWQGHGIKPPDRNFPLPEIVSGYWFRTK